MMFGDQFLKALDLTHMSNIMLLMSCGLLYLTLVLVLQLFLVCRLTSKVSAIPQFMKEFGANTRLIIIVVVTVVLNFCLLYMKLQTESFYEEVLTYLFVIIFYSLFSVVMLWLMPYDDVDFALSQNCKCSIGACWANGTVMAYYEESLNKFRDRVQKFEESHPNVKLLVKKLVLIAPLSCNIEGSLSERDERIQYIDSLEAIERDEGANINRKLISPVYEIYLNRECSFFIAAEYPSPLGTLWGERYGMDEDAKIYIRDCFLKELKDQLKSKPVIILEYDDQDPSDTLPLHEFLISSLQKTLEENNFINNMLRGQSQNYVINETTKKFVD